MNSLQIECLLALSNTLNFSKASEIVHMSQPSFSKIIASLEDEIGVELFIRNKRSVKPTMAGESFINEMSQISRQYDNAVIKAQNISSGITGYVRIGFFGTGLFRTLPLLFREFHDKYPNVSLRLKDCTHAYLSESYLGESADVLLLPSFQAIGFDDIESRLLFSDDMCVAVGKEHPLALKEEVSAKDLKDEAFIIMGRHNSLRDYDFVSHMCREASFVPKIVYEADILHNIFLMVECNVGITIFARHLQQFASANIVFIPIKEYRNRFEMYALWKGEYNPFVLPLVQLLTDLLDKEAGMQYK
ncbi:LysR family transcriptional regulator [Bacillota bacterium]